LRGEAGREVNEGKEERNDLGEEVEK